MPVPSRKVRDGTAATKPSCPDGFVAAARILGGQQFVSAWFDRFDAIVRYASCVARKPLRPGGVHWKRRCFRKWRRHSTT